MKAKVFISSGQKCEKERNTTKEISDYIKSKGFEPYVATRDQQSRDIVYNIFRNLEDAEYFIFVDFYRKEDMYSLFSHQELAIWHYKLIDADTFDESLFYCQEDVKVEVGIRAYMQNNPTIFNTHKRLLDLVKNDVKDRVDKGKWNPTSKNKLAIKVISSEGTRAMDMRNGQPSTWYHAVVSNLNKKHIARDCAAYVTEVSKLVGDTYQPLKQQFEMVELKWRSLVSGRTQIPPNHQRGLDILHTYDSVPNMALLGFNPFIVDSTVIEHQYEIRDAGKYRISVELYSLNFPTVQQHICFTLDKTIQEFGICKDSREDGKKAAEKKGSKPVSKKPMESSTSPPGGGIVAGSLSPGVYSQHYADQSSSYSGVTIVDTDY